MKSKQEEVGDLFVAENILTLKLMPSKKSGSKTIRWFNDGHVSDARAAARDIAALVEKVQGKSRIVKRLTLMTDQGTQTDLSKTGLPRAVQKAGYIPLENES